MTIIIDLDDTLLNTNELKRQLVQSCRSLGISPQQFWVAYRAMRQKGENSPSVFVEYLPQQYRTQRKRIISALNRAYHNVAKCLYKDAIPFLKVARRHGDKLVLYTYGEKVTQWNKIRWSGIKKYFSSVIVTTDSRKTSHLRSLRRVGMRCVMIDDFHSGDVTKLREAGIEPLYIRRRHVQQPQINGVKTFSSLTQIRDYLF